jgi:hypothetical protein
VLSQEWVHKAIASADALEEQTLGAVVEEFVVAVGGVALISKGKLKTSSGA